VSQGGTQDRQLTSRFSTGGPAGLAPDTGSRLGAFGGRFGCHSSTDARPLLCAGWLLAGADGNEEILEMFRTGALAMPDLPDGVEVYGSYTEMAVANGVAADGPALQARPEQAPPEEDFIPLGRFLDEAGSS
jgi:hypothetical protein